MIKLNARGDTIVEVLIAIIVLSTVLVTAYALATRSLKENQQAQEHSQALKIAEGQLEALKAYYDTGNAVSPGVSFCFATDGTAVLNSFGSGEPTVSVPDPKLNTNPGGYPVACTRKLADGSTCSAGSGTCFYVGVRHYDDNGKIFTVSVRWDSIISGQDQVSLNYRTYEQ
jgi:Tfp pilus assembly protein PilV